MGQRKKRDRQAYLEAGADLLCKKAYQLCKESCAPKTAADAKALKETGAVLKEAAAIAAALDKGEQTAATLKVVFEDVPEEYAM